MEFDYLDEDNDGIYTTGITTPPVEGTFEILTAISYKYQKTPKIVRLTTVIDPEGYVYETTRKGIEARIPNATVSLYFKTQTEDYILWPASEFNQENPQITTNNGKYSFLVPEGTYYLKIEANDYHSYQSNNFEVREGESIHEDVELEVIRSWFDVVFGTRMLMIILIIVGLGLLIGVVIVIIQNKNRK